MNKYLFASWVRLDGSSTNTSTGAGNELIERASSLDLGPSAIYHLTGGGEHMAELGRRVARLDLDPALSTSDFVVVVELDGIEQALGDDGVRRTVARTLDDLGAAGYYQALFIESEHTQGPEPVAEDGFGGAIQFGTFSMNSEEGDWDVAAWYTDLRLPSIEEMPGAQRARRLFSVAGAPKFGIFYEFTSLEARQEHFEGPHERYALDPDHPTGRVVEKTVHSPMSPSVGTRVFPT